jgi:hypothetical protein
LVSEPQPDNTSASAAAIAAAPETAVGFTYQLLSLGCSLVVGNGKRCSADMP